MQMYVCTFYKRCIWKEEKAEIKFQKVEINIVEKKVHDQRITFRPRCIVSRLDYRSFEAIWEVKSRRVAPRRGRRFA